MGKSFQKFIDVNRKKNKYMYFSKKLSLLYIACPKTGSRSIESHLMKIDANGEKHGITLKNKKITSKDMHYGVVGHARAWEF